MQRVELHALQVPLGLGATALKKMYPKNYMIHPDSILKDRTRRMRLLCEDARRFIGKILGEEV